MWTYQAPVADLLYLMDAVLGAPALLACRGRAARAVVAA